MMYCVYLVSYKGSNHPPYYIGSTSIEKIQNGYLGSPKSIKWINILKEEMKNKDLYEVSILQTTKTRKKAIDIELKIQKHFEVVKSDLFWNESYASPNGFFGRDVSGKNNPMYGKDWRVEKTEEEMEEYRKKHSIHSKEVRKNKSKEEMEDWNRKVGEGCKKYWEENPEELEKLKQKIRNALVFEERTCPHCGLVGKGGAMTRWHFDNCKENK